MPRDIEEARAPGTSEELPAGGGEHVAAGGFDIHRHLPYRLAGIEQIGNAVAARDLADRRRRIGKPAIGGDPGDGDELHSLVDHALERGHIELAAGIARHHVDPRPGSLGSLEIGHVIGGIFRLGRQDPVARLEGERVEGHLPCDGGILNQGDLLRRGV